MGPECNVFRRLDEKTWWEVRSTIVRMILHTDMSKHFKMIDELDILFKTKGSNYDFNGERDHRQLLLNLILHSSDISNPCKPWLLCGKWTELVMGEFFAQGD